MPKEAIANEANTANVLYRFYSRIGQLLYVGITMNPPERFRAHQQTKDWWAQVAGITTETYDSRVDLLAAERRAIQVEHPEYNVVHNGQAKLHTSPSASPAQRPTVARDSSLLTGRWFHTTKEPCGCHLKRRVAVRQGQILGEPTPGLLLVQLYSWLVGEPSGQELLSLDDFVAMKPVLYDTSDDMNFSYQHGMLLHSSCCGDG